LAFSVDWWVRWRETPLVGYALRESHGNFVVPLFESHFESNRKVRRSPRNWRELSDALTVHRATPSRKAKGEIITTTVDLFAFASVFGVEVGELFPLRHEWIAGATCVLCDGEVSAEDASAYAQYLFAGPEYYNPHLDRDAVKRVYDKLKSHFRTIESIDVAIMTAGLRVGTVLETHLELVS
jgi:hypothetical protein